tara:strand:- start:32 stop:1084 length:1053 start_codon:yes stop_codon:yes gene_type:complete
MSLTPKSVPTGAIRYNTDSNKMECFDGTKWWEISTSISNLGSNLGGSGRGVWGGGLTGPADPSNYSRNGIDYITIATVGNSTDFGDCTSISFNQSAGAGSATRGLFIGGYWPSAINSIDYITFSSTGNAADFGDTTVTFGKRGAFNNATRACAFGGGTDAPNQAVINTIDYVTIASTGNALDFGDMSAVNSRQSGCSSPIRGFMMNGYNYSTNTDAIKYVTTATTGNGQDFGDLTDVKKNMSSGASNSVRGFCIGGFYSPNAPTNSNKIHWFEMSSTGNGQEFGEMSAVGRMGGAVSDSVRIVMGRGIADTNYNTLEYITITTRGNALDFGDLVNPIGGAATTSNSNGGL